MVLKGTVACASLTCRNATFLASQTPQGSIELRSFPERSLPAGVPISGYRKLHGRASGEAGSARRLLEYS